MTLLSFYLLAGFAFGGACFIILRSRWWMVESLPDYEPWQTPWVILMYILFWPAVIAYMAVLVCRGHR